jgi:hypothetical protein
MLCYKPVKIGGVSLRPAASSYKLLNYIYTKVYSVSVKDSSNLIS